MSRVSGWMRTPTTELEIVIWRPSRIQAAPSPATMRVWNGDQLRRSSRAGIVLRILPVAVAALTATFPLVLRQHLGDDDSRRSLDEREVRERLWEVAEMAARRGVELLGVEAERRGDSEQSLHQVARPLQLAYDRKRGHEPEGADEEGAFLPGEPVVGLVGLVAEDVAVLGELVCNRLHRLAQGLVVVRKEAEDRSEERRGVESFRIVVLAKHTALGAVLDDVGVDLVRNATPLGLQLG